MLWFFKLWELQTFVGRFVCLFLDLSFPFFTSLMMARVGFIKLDCITYNFVPSI